MSCTCGHSSIYPICDATHRRVGRWRESENGDRFRIIYITKEEKEKHEPKRISN